MADFNRYQTGLWIVQQALKRIGLAAPVAVASNTDATAVQMWAMLTECGRELARMPFAWQFHEKTQTINTIPGTTLYALPEDFMGYVEQSGWNNTSRLPLIGPMTTQQWRMLVARNLGGTTFASQYRITEDQLELYYSPDDSQEIQIDYRGSGWVRDGTTPTTYRDYVENDSDVVLFDPELMVSMLRLKWREAKGFDTTADQVRYDNHLMYAKNNDRPAPDLNTSRQAAFPYLGYINIPDNGYGS